MATWRGVSQSCGRERVWGGQRWGVCMWYDPSGCQPAPVSTLEPPIYLRSLDMGGFWGRNPCPTAGSLSSPTSALGSPWSGCGSWGKRKGATSPGLEAVLGRGCDSILICPCIRSSAPIPSSGWRCPMYPLTSVCIPIHLSVYLSIRLCIIHLSIHPCE